MKQIVICSGILVAAFAGNAIAACGAVNGDNRLNQTQIATALDGKRIGALSPGGETWNEDHCAGGGTAAVNLYKVGSGTAVDPRALRGTWQIIGTGTNAQVRYTYFQSPPTNNPATNLVYTWQMWVRSGTSTIDFCDGTTRIAEITSSAAAGTPCP